MQIIKKPHVLSQIAISNTKLYDQIKKGLMPSPIKLGSHSVGWAKHEVDALVAARIAGKTDDDVKVIVTKLEALRPHISAKTDEQITKEVVQIVEGV